MSMMHAAAALLAALLGAGDDTLVIRNGRVIPISGPELESATVLVRDGRIAAVGKDVEVPFDARVIDATGKVVMPAFVEAHSFRGMDRPNERMPSVPFVSTFDAINPVDLYFEDCLRQGIATLCIVPGNDTLIGGQGCVIRPSGATVEEMLVVRNAFLKISLKPRPGSSRMAHVAALRRELDGAAEALKESGEKKEEPRPGAPESRREPLYRLLRGTLPAMVYCPTASDVLKAVELSETYKFRMVLVLGPDGWKAAPEIARRKLEVVLAPDFAYWETDPETHEQVRRVGTEVFAKAGVPFSLQTDGSTLGSTYLWHQAAVAVRHGLPRAEALQAATLRPARLLGLENRLGSLEKGKDATLLILTGDPLDAQTWVDQVLVEGRTVYERAKDLRLKRLLEGAR